MKLEYKTDPGGKNKSPFLCGSHAYVSAAAGTESNYSIFFFSHRSIKITLKHKYRVSRTLEFICFCICRFTYEIAPVFVLMEQLTLKKMREIIGWPESEGDGIFSPGESQSTPEIKQTQQTSMCTVIILLFLQEERSPTCTA